MPKPKIPTAIKKLNGTLQKCRTLENEMQPVLILSDIEAPENLTGAEVKIWHGLIPRLQDVGILTVTDLEMVVSYCIEYARYIECQRIIKKQGLTKMEAVGNKGEEKEVPNVHLKISNEAIKNVMKLSIEFGMTPAARTRVAAAPKEKKGLKSMLSAGFGK